VNIRTDGLRLVAEDEGQQVGEATLRQEPPRVWVEQLHADRPGVDEELFRAALDRARELERELAHARDATTSGRVYVQTDDEAAVERAARQFIPRLGRSEHTEISPPRNGWIAVADELCSREPKLLRRLAQELSYRSGGVVLSLGIEEGAVVRYILFDRGGIADEYASVPEFHGPLAPGDVIALGANPTVARRLTGADPNAVRAVARTASSPAELPPAPELLRQIAQVLGVA